MGEELALMSFWCQMMIPIVAFVAKFDGRVKKVRLQPSLELKKSAVSVVNRER